MLSYCKLTSQTSGVLIPFRKRESSRGRLLASATITAAMIEQSNRIESPHHFIKAKQGK